MTIKAIYGRYNLEHYMTISGCCGAHYLCGPLAQYQPFKGIAVADKDIGGIAGITPKIVKTRNGPLYVYLEAGTTK
jgi:hypothetical protein